MRIALKAKYSYFQPTIVRYYTNANGSAVLCRNGLHKKVDIPDQTSEIDIVFTTTPNKNSFSLINGKSACKLKETKVRLYSAAETLLNIAYEKGYRYVHIEY